MEMIHDYDFSVDTFVLRSDDLYVPYTPITYDCYLWFQSEDEFVLECEDLKISCTPAGYQEILYSFILCIQSEEEDDEKYLPRSMQNQERYVLRFEADCSLRA